MTVLDYELDGTLLTRLRPGDAPVRILVREPGEALDEELAEQLSPELVLVAPPEVADAAREALPEPVPFDEWLRRARAAEARPEPVAWDWEYARVRRRLERGGTAFTLTLAGLSLLPVVLLAVWKGL